MKNRFIIACLLLLTNLTSGFGQGKTEYSGFFDSYYYKGKHNLNFTLNVGFPFYFGDLCEVCFDPGIGFGVGVNYKLWPRVMFGGEFHYFMMKGSDNLTTRNISFTSVNMEFLGYGRFFLVDDIIRVAADRSRPPKFLKMYVMTGVGLLNYKPSSEFTEPSPPTDSSFFIPESGGGLGVVIPFGVGFSWRISNRFSIVTEAGYRLTFTDHLDEVSLRGNPKKNDGYALIDVKIQYSPFAKKKKKAKTLAPPEQYDGPKGTDTWKNRKKEPPVQKRNNYYDYEEEETPDEENPDGENPDGENPEEENPDGETPPEEETPTEEEPLPEGW